MCFPIFPGCRHSSIEIAFIRNTERIFIHIALVGWNTVQEPCEGRGNLSLNKLSKSLSSLQCHFLLLPHDLDGISVMAFSIPRMCSAVSGAAPLIFIRRAIALNNCPATSELFDDRWSTHDTVGCK